MMTTLNQYPYLVTTILEISILTITIISLLNKSVRFKLFLHPASVVKESEYYRLISSDFIHHDLVHLLLNGYLLITYGGSLEGYLNRNGKHGSIEFLAIYLTSCLFGSIATTIMHYRDSGFSSAGASGSLMGCMFSYILMQPGRIAFYLPGVGAVSNIYFGLTCIFLLIVYQIRSNNELINHEQHFFGGLGGMAMTLVLIPGLIK